MCVCVCVCVCVYIVCLVLHPTSLRIRYEVSGADNVADMCNC